MKGIAFDTFAESTKAASAGKKHIFTATLRLYGGACPACKHCDIKKIKPNWLRNIILSENSENALEVKFVKRYAVYTKKNIHNVLEEKSNPSQCC